MSECAVICVHPVRETKSATTAIIEVFNTRNFDITDFNGKGRLGFPVPGTFVISQDGIITAAYANTDYKKRMEPRDIIEALELIK